MPAYHEMHWMTFIDTRTRSEYVTGKQRLRDDAWLETRPESEWRRYRRTETGDENQPQPLSVLSCSMAARTHCPRDPTPNDSGHSWSKEDGTMTRAKDTAFNDAPRMPKWRWLRVTTLCWLSPASTRLALEHLTCERVTSASTLEPCGL